VPRNKGASTTTALDDFQFPDLLLMPWPNAKGNSLPVENRTLLRISNIYESVHRQGAWQMGPAWAFSYAEFQGCKLLVCFSRGPRSHIHLVAFGARQLDLGPSDSLVSTRSRIGI